MIKKLLFLVGKGTLALSDKTVHGVGKFTIFQLEVLKLFFARPFRMKEILRQVEVIGINSFFVIFLTALFTGMVVAIQLYNGFHRFHAENFIGYTIYISICKELGPVFASLMLISRAGSGMAAELGTMRVTEQIDALDVMAINSRQYLIVPKMIATLISLPILILLFDAISNIGAYMVSVHVLDINSHAYLNTIRQFAMFDDFTDGLIKGLFFAYFIAAIATYYGYQTRGGAKGVGESTTRSVVLASVVVFIVDYMISALFIIFDV